MEIPNFSVGADVIAASRLDQVPGIQKKFSKIDIRSCHVTSQLAK